MTPKMRKLAAGAGTAAALRSAGSNIYSKLLQALRWDPAITSTALGAGAGALAAGEDRRLRGIALGGLGGLAGGLMGAGLRGGTAQAGQPRRWVAEVMGKDPTVHQHLLGTIGGLTAGTLIQPEPKPVLVRTRADAAGKSEGLINKAQEMLEASKPEIERV